MEPLFNNKCTYTKANLLEVARSTSSRKLRTIIFISIGILFIILGFLTGDYITCLIGIVFCFIFPLIFLWIVRFPAANRYQQFKQLYHVEPESNTNFYEDHLVQSIHGGTEVTVDYHQIAKVYETQNIFFLMLSTRVGFMLDKKRFEGKTAEEFREFIRARAVGEGQADLKKRKRKSTLIMIALILVIFTVCFSIAYFEDAIESKIPKTFTNDNYSIKLTSAFDGYEGEWDNPDASVYSFNETKEELSSSGLVFKSAASYLQDTNKSEGINSAVTAISDTVAWTEYKSSSDGREFYNYDYVIMTGGEFWFTEFYCITEDAGKYKPLFKKWAKTIKITRH